MRHSRRVVVLCSCVLIAACATPGSILTDSMTPISAGLEQAKQQSDLTFTKTNELARDVDVARVLGGDAKNLADADFPQAIKLEDRRKWANAFTALQSYARNLQNLVDPSRADATKTNLVALAGELNTGPVQAGLPAAAVGAFAELAKVLVQLHAERTAQDIMRRTDPAFTDVMSGMADTIGSDNTNGLLFTTRSYYESALASIRTDYNALMAQQKNPDAAKRKALVDQYLKVMDTRDAQLAGLGSLRDSLTALAQAHHAAAYGNQGDALFWIQRISTWLDEAKKDETASSKKSGDAK